MSFLAGCNLKKEVTPISGEYILLAVSNNGSSICQSLRFGVDKEKMTEISSSLKEELEFRKSLKSKIETLRNEILLSFAILYLQNPVKEYRLNSGVILTNVAYDDKNSCFGFDVVFTSLAAWNYYHQSEKEEGKKGGFFIDRQVSRGTFPFSVKMKEENIFVGERYKNVFLSALSGFSFEEKLKNEYSPQYLYLYSTPYGKIKSDATYTYRGKENLYHHLWVKEDLKENDTILLKVTSINYGMWILMVLVLSLTGMAIGIIIVITHSRRKKNLL